MALIIGRFKTVNRQQEQLANFDQSSATFLELCCDGSVVMVFGLDKCRTLSVVLRETQDEPIVLWNGQENETKPANHQSKNE